MRLLFSSDLHGNIPLYEELLRLAVEEGADAVILGGDLLPLKGPFYQRIREQIEFVSSYLGPALEDFRSLYPHKSFYLLHGNTDWLPAVRLLEQFAQTGLFHFLHGTIHPVGGSYRIAGYAHVPPTPFIMKEFERLDLRTSPLPVQETTPCCSNGPRIVVVNSDEHFRSRPSIEEELEALAKPPESSGSLYVLHSPPLGTGLDVITSGEPVGSRAIRNFIQRRQPRVTLHGHVHEAPAMSGVYASLIGKTLCVNPGQTPTVLHAVFFDPDDLPGSLEHTVYGRYSPNHADGDLDAASREQGDP